MYVSFRLGQLIAVVCAFRGLNASATSNPRDISEKEQRGSKQHSLAQPRSSSTKHVADEIATKQPTDDTNWYDCSLEIGIENLVTFSDVQSVPLIVTPTSGQTILKTLRYHVPDDSSEPSALEQITVDFHQYYKLFDKTWITFLIVHNVDECKEHPNLCPLAQGEEKRLETRHPPLNPATPYGWYRSRQVYKDGETGAKIGCVDMKFQYCSTTDTCRDDGDTSRVQ
jgi:hypothetical protein